MDPHPAVRGSRRRFVAAALALALTVCFYVQATRALAGTYWSPIHAVVLSVDRHRKTVTIRHEALETVPAGVRVCAVRDARTLTRLRGGELIEARAETSHAEWVLDGIRVVPKERGTSQPSL